MSCAHSAPALLASQIFLDHVKLFFFFCIRPFAPALPSPQNALPLDPHGCPVLPPKHELLREAASTAQPWQPPGPWHSILIVLDHIC